VLVDQKEFEFEVVEYLDNSNPHPPPKEPISSEKIFDNLDENSEAISLTVPLPTSQPSGDSIQDNENMEDNFSLQIPYHYESGWPSTMTVICKNYQNFTRFSKLQSLVE
jgi:hypothetical protein